MEKVLLVPPEYEETAKAILSNNCLIKSIGLSDSTNSTDWEEGEWPSTFTTELNITDSWVTTTNTDNCLDNKLYFTPPTTGTIDNVSWKEIKPKKYLKTEICFYNENTDEFEVEEITIFESLSKFIEDNADYYNICSYKFKPVTNNNNLLEKETFEDIDSIIEFLEGCQEIFKEAKEEIEQRQINKSNKLNSGHNHDGVDSTDVAKELVKNHSKIIKSRELIKKKTNKDLLGV